MLVALAEQRAQSSGTCMAGPFRLEENSTNLSGPFRLWYHPEHNVSTPAHTGLVC